ncbi:MAG: hypothetical protein IT572_11520 [Deltaproteobacteria bacterium]|nr:hypothetical protein [Deltaproteobacteria bacterium]
MADTYVTNQGFSPVDTRQLMRQADAFSRSHDVIGDAGFNKALGIAQDVMSLAGPTIGAAAPFMGMKGAAITGAAVSAFAGPGGQLGTPGFAPMGGQVAYGAGKSLAMPGTAPGFPGAGGAGGMPGTAPGFPGAGGGAGMPMGSSASQFDAQINAMATQQVEMLSLQARVQNVSQVGQMMSNIAKTDSDAKLNAIRNIRA